MASCVMRQAAEAVGAPGADVERASLCSEAGEGIPEAAAGAPGRAPSGKGCSVSNGKAAHPEPQTQGPSRRRTRSQAERAADLLPAGLQPQGKEGSPVGGSGGAAGMAAQRSVVASGAQAAAAEDGAAAAGAAGSQAGGADKVWWRVSDTQVRAVDWETVARGQAYILMYERSPSSSI